MPEQSECGGGFYNDGAPELWLGTLTSADSAKSQKVSLGKTSNKGDKGEGQQTLGDLLAFSFIICMFINVKSNKHAINLGLTAAEPLALHQTRASARQRGKGNKRKYGESRKERNERERETEKQKKKIKHACLGQL